MKEVIETISLKAEDPLQEMKRREARRKAKKKKRKEQEEGDTFGVLDRVFFRYLSKDRIH